MTASEEVVQRLDKLIAIMQIAHKDEIERARTEIVADKIDAAILKATARETSAGKVVKAAASRAKTSERAVQEHVAELVARGLVEKSGGGPATKYRATGLI